MHLCLKAIFEIACRCIVPDPFFLREPLLHNLLRAANPWPRLAFVSDQGLTVLENRVWFFTQITLLTFIT